jgi:hypothetical protein
MRSTKALIPTLLLGNRSLEDGMLLVINVFMVCASISEKSIVIPKTLALELEILEEIQAKLGLDKKKEKKHKATPILDLSKTDKVLF